jgi:hypothetical protein
MALDHSCQVQRHTLSERGADLYGTPPVAVEALLRVERIPHKVWEPAAGRGAIVEVLRAAGHAVTTSDLIDYGFPASRPMDGTQGQLGHGVRVVLLGRESQRSSHYRPYRLETTGIRRAGKIAYPRQGGHNGTP